VTVRARRSTSSRGFGILEVLISGSLLAVGLAGIVSFAGQANAIVGHQRHVTIASHVAEVQLEKLLTLYADDTRLSDGAHAGSSFKVDGSPGSGPYTTSWVVVTGSPIAGARRVMVTVTWQEAGVAKTLSLQTIRT
jgi:Tfp pilus assembly protein PilV